MMPPRAQYLNYKYEEELDHESIDSLEFSWTNNAYENIYFNGRTFYNKIHTVGFTGRKLEFLTDISLVGFEFETNIKVPILSSIQSLLLQATNIEMNDALKDGSNRNNVSFGDYYYETGGDVPSFSKGMEKISTIGPTTAAVIPLAKSSCKKA